MKRLLLLGLTVVAGCTGSTTAPPQSVAEKPPINYKPAVIRHVKEKFFDPYSIRDASISQPLYATGLFDGASLIPHSGWAVCLKANAKNRMGGYTGQSYTVVLFDGNSVSMSFDGPATYGQMYEICKKGTFEPFPEIESLA